MIKSATINGRTVRLGRQIPKLVYPHLQMRNYLLRAIPAPPLTCNYYIQRAMPELENIYENDILGDCVIAMMGHGEAIVTGNNPGLSVSSYTNDQITGLYSAIGGYVPGQPNTDQGCVIQDALHYWQNTGMPDGRKILGYIGVNAADPVEVRTAIWLFEFVTAGIALPDAWLNSTNAGATWSVAGAPDPNNGHCILAGSYNTAGYSIDTWGEFITLTNSGMEKYAVPDAGGELYAVVTQDVINRATQRAPSGFQWRQIIADCKALESHVISLR
jgi:hypothetical protein